MTPIYFPYTTPSEKVWKAFGALDGQPLVYLPSSTTATVEMRQWAQQGRVKLRMPSEPVDKKLQVLLKDYRSWAELHAGSRFAQTVLLAHQTGQDPPPGDRFVAQLKTDIQRMVQGPQHRPDTASDEASMLAARLFLSFAHALDAQHRELAEDFETNAELEQQLLQNLHGTPLDTGGPIAFPESIRSRDTREYMITERLRAWSRIFLADPPSLSGDAWMFFVTDCSLVVDSLQEHFREMELMLHIHRLPSDAGDDRASPAWRASLRQRLEQEIKGKTAEAAPAESPAPPAPDPTAPALRIYKIGHHPPDTVFQRLAGEPLGSDIQMGGKWMHTLIGLIDDEAGQG